MNARKNWLKKRGPQQIPLRGPMRKKKPGPDTSKRKPRARKNKRKLRVQKRSYTNHFSNDWTKHFSSNWARPHTRHPIPTRRTHVAFRRRHLILRRSRRAIGRLMEHRSLGIRASFILIR